MSKRCIIKKYKRKAVNEYLSDVKVNKDDLIMICDLATKALDDHKPKAIKPKDNGIFYVCGDCARIVNNCLYCPDCGREIDWSDDE